MRRSIVSRLQRHGAAAARGGRGHGRGAGRRSAIRPRCTASAARRGRGRGGARAGGGARRARRPAQVVFTSGGTEANNLALDAAAGRARILVSAIEHDLVLSGRAGRGDDPRRPRTASSISRRWSACWRRGRRRRWSRSCWPTTRPASSSRWPRWRGVAHAARRAGPLRRGAGRRQDRRRFRGARRRSAVAVGAQARRAAGRRRAASSPISRR